MKKWARYLLDNKNNGGYIYIEYMSKWAIVYPACAQIKVKTADEIIKQLDLKGLPAYKACRNHATGDIYVFEENLKEY